MSGIYRNAARKLLAAMISHRLGLSSVDYTLKKYVPDDDDIDPFWEELAQHLDTKMAEATGKYLSPREPGEKIQ